MGCLECIASSGGISRGGMSEGTSVGGSVGGGGVGGSVRHIYHWGSCVLKGYQRVHGGLVFGSHCC